jgi:hypothetical protein
MTFLSPCRIADYSGNVRYQLLSNEMFDQLQAKKTSPETREATLPIKLKKVIPYPLNRLLRKSGASS